MRIRVCMLRVLRDILEDRMRSSNQEDGSPHARSAQDVPGGIQQRPEHPALIDILEDSDDDVSIISRADFDETTRRNRRNTVASEERIFINEDVGFLSESRRVDFGQPSANTEEPNTSYLGLAPPPPPPPPPPPSPRAPEEDIFNCPICYRRMVEPTSTKCGHLFCKRCLRTSLAHRSQCPMCRRPVTARSSRRIYLPGTN